jgi:hypothetical protein
LNKSQELREENQKLILNEPQENDVNNEQALNRYKNA